MSSTDEPAAMPDEIIERPTTSYEVVQESYEGPRATFDSLQADTSARPSMDTTQLSDGHQPFSSSDYEQKSAKSDS